MDFKQTLRELQRRHVVKAGLAYLAISWGVVEVATAVLPLFEVSEGFLKGLVVLLAIGFPIWLIIAWVYCKTSTLGSGTNILLCLSLLPKYRIRTRLSSLTEISPYSSRVLRRVFSANGSIGEITIWINSCLLCN